MEPIDSRSTTLVRTIERSGMTRLHGKNIALHHNKAEVLASTI